MKRFFWTLLACFAVQWGYAAEPLPELLDYLDGKLVETSLGETEERFEVSFDTPEPGVELTWQQVELLGVPLLGVEYKRFCVTRRFVWPEGVVSLLVISTTEHEIFAELVNFDSASNWIGGRSVAYDQIAGSLRRIESRIEGRHLFISEWYVDGAVRMSGCKVREDGVFDNFEDGCDVYPLRKGYDLYQSYCHTDEGTEYLLALCSQADSWVVDNGNSPAMSRHIPRYAGVDTEDCFGLVTYEDIARPVLILYDKATHAEILMPDNCLLCDFNDDSGLLLYYADDSEKNPEGFLTLFDLESRKSMPISPDDFITDPNQMSPFWWLQFKIEKVDARQVEILYDAEKPVRKSYPRVL